MEGKTCYLPCMQKSTFYLLGHCGTWHFCVSLVFILQLVGYQHNFICFVFSVMVCFSQKYRQSLGAKTWGTSKVFSSLIFYTMNLLGKGECQMVNKCIVRQAFQVLAHCHVLTICYALNTCDLIEGSSLLEKNCDWVWENRPCMHKS